MVTRSMVKDTMEYHWRGQQWKLYLVVLALVAVVTTLINVPNLKNSGASLEVLLWSNLVYVLVFLPFVLYHVFRQWQLLWRCDHYQKYSVKLCNPVTSMLYKHAVYYRVIFRTETGENLVRNTSPVFSSAAFAVFLLEDYNNKTVDIYYDEEKDKVILVGNRR